jgi:hypothetical protein
MTWEHEAFHAETLLYMLLQRAGTGTIPPPGFSPPSWASLSEIWDSAPKPASSTVTLGPAKVVIGHDDDESEDANGGDVATHEYGWDNEHPKRMVDVQEFKIEWRPVTNRQFYEFYCDHKGKGIQLPASWIEIEGEMHVSNTHMPLTQRIDYGGLGPHPAWPNSVEDSTRLASHDFL